ncbi:MAG: tyrosine-type recombinase/integrase [Candidatus Omnitrophica bacterium]|nr:tyrosine-type recombinase/integrase [Candidatus Omnitrophota bacterium]
MAGKKKKYTGVRTIVKGEKYEIKWAVDGQKRQHRIEASSEKQAFEQRMKEIFAYQKERAAGKEPGGFRSVDFDTAWEALRDDIKSDVELAKTLGRYKMTYWRMFRDFRGMYFPHVVETGQLRLPFFRQYRNYYANDLGRPEGIRTELIQVKALVNRMYSLGFCTRELMDEMKGFKKPPAKKKEYPDISDSDINRLMDEMKKERPDYFMILYFIKRVGRRINETTLIERRDVVLHGFRPVAINIRAETTKTKEDAPLEYMDRDLLKHIHRALSGNRTEWLFPNKYGRRCHPNRVRDFLKRKSMEVLGIELTPHYFRHRFCTECGKANIPIADIKAVSGIKDTKVLLEYYSHSTKAGQKQVLEITR